MSQQNNAHAAIQGCNDFVIKFANVNGSGSASANELFARAIMRMGVPVAVEQCAAVTAERRTFRGCRPGMSCGCRPKAGWGGVAVAT